MTTLLCIVAHPDDETMLCGGTLAALAMHGVAVAVLCATRGEGGELGEPPVCTREELGRVREMEMRCACQSLGAQRLAFLEYVDPLVGPDDTLSPFTEDEQGLRDQLLIHMRRLQPDIVLTHGRDGEYGHPAHKLTHRASWAAFQQLLPTFKTDPQRNGPIQFYTFAATIPGHEDRILNRSEPAHLIFDLGGSSCLDAKEAAALCHTSQHALFKRRKEAKTVREVLRRVRKSPSLLATQWTRRPCTEHRWL